MPTDQQLDPDDPRIVAWEKYKQTDDYANTREWALHQNHITGSLWAAFLQGYKAAKASPRATEETP